MQNEWGKGIILKKKTFIANHRSNQDPTLPLFNKKPPGPNPLRRSAKAFEAFCEEAQAEAPSDLVPVCGGTVGYPKSKRMIWTRLFLGDVNFQIHLFCTLASFFLDFAGVNLFHHLENES